MHDSRHAVNGGASIAIRLATAADLSMVVRLLADDPLGAAREQVADPLPEAYRVAFAAMQAQGGNALLVATHADVVVGCLQLTIIPGISRLGALRAQIEGVRVATTHRGSGIGGILMRDAIDRARSVGCSLIQLTTDAARPDARRFYERLGFEATHLGMKCRITPT
ncbi:MAG: GNAT family N-acetyltransferase [Gemmatimonadales bacterium]|nr:GNAT family N-acetyltransferase [Gemmatimonadales bacterium]MDZ4390228.1 GNAT family N-acetyltransferase [Gemmatimonadales bacterium]